MTSASDQSPLSPDPERLAAFMAGDGALEPPPEALARAKALGARLAHRAGATPAARLLAIGAVLDRTLASIGEWLQGPSPAIAGLRDDRGAELLDASVAAIELHCERIVLPDGRSRIVGEVFGPEGATVRATVAILDASDRVLAACETDSLGMFALEAGSDACSIAVEARAPRRTVVLLPLARAQESDA